MHLRPAKYSPLKTERFEEPPSESNGSLVAARSLWKNPSLSSTSSSFSSSTTATAITSPTIDPSSGNQFMASGQQSTYSPANMFNAKLNGNPLQLNQLQQQYGSNELIAAGVGASKANVKLLMPDTMKPNTKTNNHNNYNNSAMKFSKHDKIKLMEVSIINLVELSTLAAEEGKQELALERAKEALEGFSSLKVALMAQEKSVALFKAKNKTNDTSSSDGDLQQSVNSTAPMTTGVSLYELSLMINSNLAAQLSNNGQFEESIELYTQLCKMATNLGSNSNQATMIGSSTTSSSSSSSRSQHETRFLLYRFGLNIGNIYYKMQEYQRALKYYRLTLDRLSAPSFGYKNLKVKIMHNIALTLIELNQSQDATTSLNLLLSDNLVSSNDSKSTSSYPSLEACNSNHHEFGLNLMICHHQRADLNSMMTTFKALVKVGICQHYERVFDLTAIQNFKKVNSASATNEDFNDGRQSSSSSSSTMTMITAASAVNPTSVVESVYSLAQNQAVGRNRQGNYDEAMMNLLDNQNLNRVTYDNQGGSSFLGATQRLQQTIVDNKLKGDMEMDADLYENQNRRLLTSEQTADRCFHTNALGGQQVATVENHNHKQVNHQYQEHRSSTKLSIAERSRQLMRLIQEDRLEKLIGDKHKQISRSLIMCCNLMLDLDNQIAQSTAVGLNKRTSVFEFCLKLLSQSESYKTLVYELKANSACEMLVKKYKLDEAVAVLKQLEQEQQVDKQQHHQQQQSKDNTGKSSLMTKNLLTNRYNSNNLNNQNMLNKSSMVATNCLLLNLLQCNTKRALEYGNRALKEDKFNAKALINLANCHYLLNHYDIAESLYQQALIIDPNCWEANYNLSLMARKRGQQFNELKDTTRLMLTKYRQCFSSLIWHNMILLVIQLALVYHQSGLHQQSRAIINDLLSSSKQVPEVLLLASRLIDDQSPSSSSSITKEPTKPSIMSILQQANGDHPYHLPVAERLIALSIQAFNYEQARALLCTCIINRPDQAKWYQMLAECYRRAADYNKAIATYKSAVDTFPQDTSCLKALIKLTDELGLMEEKRNCVNKLEKALRRQGFEDSTAVGVGVDVRTT